MENDWRQALANVRTVDQAKQLRIDYALSIWDIRARTEGIDSLRVVRQNLGYILASLPEPDRVRVGPLLQIALGK